MRSDTEEGVAKGCKARITIPKVLQMVWASSRPMNPRAEDHYSREWRLTVVGGLYSVKWLNGEQRSLGFGTREFARG